MYAEFKVPCMAILVTNFAHNCDCLAMCIFFNSYDYCRYILRTCSICMQLLIMCYSVANDLLHKLNIFSTDFRIKVATQCDIAMISIYSYS